ncbi:MAG: TonB-dependent receptor, partial [Pseudomonadota bacterium]
MAQKSALFGSRFIARLLLHTTIVPALALGAAGSAAAQQTQGMQAIEYSAGAGPLSSRLNSFAEAAGITLSFNPTDLAGLNAPAVSGPLTPSEGFDRLLSGSGWTWRFVSQNVVTVEPVAPVTGGPGVLSLARINVLGRSQAPSRFDTPQSITVVDAEDLEKDRAATGFEEALRRAPNVLFTGTENGFLEIRGEQSEGSGNSAFGIIPGRLSPTPVTIDGRPLAYGEITFGTGSVYDVDFIEVVLGPQTTGGGINGAIGAVNVTTKDPTKEFELEGFAQAGSFDQVKLAGLVSGPIIENELFARASFDANFRDTYLNYTNPNLIPSPDEIFEFTQVTARAKFVWLPGFDDDLRVEGSYSFNQSDGPQTERIFGPNTRASIENFERTSSNVAAFFNQSHSGYLETSYDLSSALQINNHFTGAFSELSRRSGNGTFRLDQDTLDFQNELSADFTALDGRLTVSPGVIVRRQNVEMDWDYFGPSPIDDQRTSLGLYAEGTFEIVDGLRATAGLRYQYEAQDRTGILSDNEPDSLNNPTTIDFDETFDAFLPRFGLEYDITEDLRVGAFAARGFTPGGFTFVRPSGDLAGDGVTPFLLPEFEEETRWTFEAYLRSKHFDDRVELFANFFYNDINNLQLRESVLVATNPDIFSSVVRNAERGRTYGAEISVAATPTPWLELSGSVGLLQTEIQEFSEAPSIEGNDLEQAPSFSASFSFDVEPVEDVFIGATLS